MFGRNRSGVFCSPPRGTLHDAKEMYSEIGVLCHFANRTTYVSIRSQKSLLCEKLYHFQTDLCFTCRKLNFFHRKEMKNVFRKFEKVRFFICVYPGLLPLRNCVLMSIKSRRPASWELLPPWSDQPACLPLVGSRWWSAVEWGFRTLLHP